MSNNDPTKPDPVTASETIIVTAAQSIAAMFEAAGSAISTDITDLIAKNGAAKPPPDNGARGLTRSMITLLGERIRAVLPKTDAAKSSSDTETS